MKEDFQSSSLWVILGIIGLTAVVFVPVVIWNMYHSSSRKTNREIAMECTTDMATQFHIHPHLEIIVNGEPQELPANIGITDGCMNALHTHDDSGVIHVESPQKRDFQLSDFFAVWGKAYTKDQIFDYKADDTHVIRQTINGKETQDFENTVLYDEDQIVISYEEIKPAQ